jgi:hypothetical protein
MLAACGEFATKRRSWNFHVHQAVRQVLPAVAAIEGAESIAQASPAEK